MISDVEEMSELAEEKVFMHEALLSMATVNLSSHYICMLGIRIPS
jgi:hypothetical protein